MLDSRNARHGAHASAGGLNAALAIALLLTVFRASAGDWQFTPRLSVGETYTDNVRLVEDGERGDFITTITPGLSVRGNSARLQTNVDYNLQRLQYGHETEFNATNHQLQSNADAILVENWLYFASTGRMSQQTIDNRRRFVRSNRGPDDNRRDVLSYEFQPSVRHSFGSWVDLDASYTNSTIDQSGGAAGFGGNASGDEETYAINLATGRRFARTPLQVFAQQREANYDSGRVAELERYGAQASYVFNRKFRLNVTGGHDSNTFPTSRGNQSGPYWTVGGTWTPSPRTSLGGAWGKRFFGDTFNIDGQHRHKRWSINGSYSEEVQTAADFERQLILVPLLDNQGLPIFDPITSSEILVPVDNPSAADDVFVVRQASAGVGYTLRRGSVNLRFFQFDREFQAGGFDELTRGASFNFDWRLSPRLGWAFNTYWRENGRSGGGNTGNGTGRGTGTVYSISPSLDYQLGPHTAAVLRYEFTRNEGGLGFGGGFGGGGQNYTENALTANLVFNL